MVVVRVEFSDDRAEEFLTAGAGQLPKGEPGLIMLQSGAIGADRTWVPLLERRLQPRHARQRDLSLFRKSSWHRRRGGVAAPHRSHRKSLCRSATARRTSSPTKPVPIARALNARPIGLKTGAHGGA